MENLLLNDKIKYSTINLFIYQGQGKKISIILLIKMKRKIVQKMAIDYGKAFAMFSKYC